MAVRLFLILQGAAWPAIMVLSLIQACADAIRTSRRTGLKQRTCLTFMLSGNLFGIDTGHIKEIVRCGILAVPRGKPACIRGFFRHDGRMLPIVDLARRYSDHSTDIGGRTCVVVVELGVKKQEIGILVDEVRGLAEFEEDDLKPLPDMFRRMIAVDIVEGLISSPRDVLVMLGIQRLLSREESKMLYEYCKDMYA